MLNLGCKDGEKRNTKDKQTTPYCISVFFGDKFLWKLKVRTFVTEQRRSRSSEAVERCVSVCVDGGGGYDYFAGKTDSKVY